MQTSELRRSFEASIPGRRQDRKPARLQMLDSIIEYLLHCTRRSPIQVHASYWSGRQRAVGIVARRPTRRFQAPLWYYALLRFSGVRLVPTILARHRLNCSTSRQTSRHSCWGANRPVIQIHSPGAPQNHWLVREKVVENLLAENHEVRSHLLASPWWFPTAQVRIRW